jgi:hypothetical protein
MRTPEARLAAPKRVIVVHMLGTATDGEGWLVRAKSLGPMTLDIAAKWSRRAEPATCGVEDRRSGLGGGQVEGYVGERSCGGRRRGVLAVRHAASVVASGFGLVVRSLCVRVVRRRLIGWCRGRWR